MNGDSSFSIANHDGKGCLTNGNRFCRYRGPFYHEHLLVLQNQEQMLVGGCWFESLDPPDEPTRLICNRCAHKRLVGTAGAGAKGRVWLLLCPFCGEPLGKPRSSYRLFSSKGETLTAFQRLPESVALVAFLDSEELSEFPASSDAGDDFFTLAVDALRNSDYLSALSFSKRALIQSPDNELARTLRDHCSMLCAARARPAATKTVGGSL